MYDSINNLAYIKDTDNNIIKKFLYDDDGRVVKEMDAGGYLSGTDDNSRYATLYSYDLAGNLIQKKEPLKKENNTVYYKITRYTYDKMGRLLTEKSSRDYITINGEPSSWNYNLYL